MSILVGYETFIWERGLVQMLGFCFLILGNFTYNELIVFKFCGLNRDTRNYILTFKKENEKED